jgi:sodium/potassium-transporting ATPase subunit alpha
LSKARQQRSGNIIVLGCLLFTTITLLATTHYLKERAAGSVAAQLRNLLPLSPLLRREGREMSLPATELVVGDVVRLTLGTCVPAHLKLIRAKDLKLDFSCLTGTPMHKKPLHGRQPFG